MFLSNVGRWVNVEKEHLEEERRLKRLTYRVVASQESVLFIRICMGELKINSSMKAIDRIKLESKNILEEHAEYNENLLEEVLASLNYNIWWKVYDGIKEYHPYIR